MSLQHARFRNQPVGPTGPGPYDPDLLLPLKGKRFSLPADDPFVQSGGDDAHAYLEGAHEAWIDHPEYMDILDHESPIYDLKLAERDLYLHWWKPWLGAQRVLDVGCGVGRFSMAFLDRGADVVGVDADLKSLQRCAWHAAGRNGRIDLHWSSVHTLPEGPFDCVVAAEVLCYVPDLESALQAIVDRLTPGGSLLISMEARYGWAACTDAQPETLEAALGADPVVKADQRWVRTMTAEDLQYALESAGLKVERLVGSHWIPDGPLEDCAPIDLSLEELIAWEDRARKHPVWGPLNRLWLAVAIKPAT